jgi:hypothetical protein
MSIGIDDIKSSIKQSLTSFGKINGDLNVWFSHLLYSVLLFGIHLIGLIPEFFYTTIELD